MKRILLGAVTIAGAVSAMSLGVTGAFFSDTETSTGNTFAAGEIDLLIDNTSYYNGVANPGTSWPSVDLTDEKFFDFDDLKPDDWGEDTISIHVDTNDAYMCAEVTLTSNDDNGINEPEAGDGDVTDGAGAGELAGLVEFVWWADDGDNVLEDGEEVISQGPIGALTLNEPFSVALADSETNIWEDELGPIVGGDDYYIGKAWCFGSIGESALPQDEYPDGPAGDNNDNTTAGEPEDGGITCDGSLLDNQSQTDSLTADVSFSAVQARNNPDFVCEVPEIVRECTIEEQYAIAFHDVDQGDRKNGSAVLLDRSDANFALGAPESGGDDYDSPVIASSFFSLGFFSQPPGGTATTTPGGSIVLEFPGEVVAGPGPDLKLWEVTGGTSYPDEIVRVEVSNSLAGPWTLVEASATRDAEMELPVASAKYVRITDVSPPGPFETTADGFDLDAVQALNCVIPEQV